jgi:DNA-binding CsgD family transcriptional regulator
VTIADAYRFLFSKGLCENAVSEAYCKSAPSGGPIVSLWNSKAVASAFVDAAISPELWVKAMDTIARETLSVGAILIPMQGAIPNIPVSESIRLVTEAYFRDGWWMRDERFRCRDTLMCKGVADDFDFITAEEMERHPYYQEFLRPFNLKYFAGVKMTAGDDLWCVSIQRSPQQGPFAADEKRELAALSQQLSSAAALARALGFASANAAMEAFEVSGSAVALLNRRGEVLRLNDPAKVMMSAEVRIVQKRIVWQDKEATATLDRALHVLLWAAAASALMPPVSLPRRGRRPILAYPLKLSSVSASVLADCQALLVFVDLEKRVRPPQEVLHSTFALTAAEARLAIRLASGAPLEVVAGELRISKETARTQLKSIFQRTGVHRQSELVGLLACFLNSRK